MSCTKITRRQFVAASAAAVMAAPAIMHGRNLGEQLKIAIIGSGGRGASNLSSVSGEQIVALCDVNAQALDRAGAKFPQARKTNDFRRLFDNPRHFDAVVVSTADHCHANATVMALRMGKHVYCEKPLTHTVAEARLVAAEAAKAKTATQLGTQIHATENYRRVVEMIQSGMIGSVNRAHVFVNSNYGLNKITDAGAEPHRLPSGPTA